MRSEINADIIFPMPELTLGMGFKRIFVGISKISAYGTLK